MNRNKGFTLLELLIVIGILAVIATTAVLVINPAEMIKNARIKGTQESLNALADAIVKIKGFKEQSLMQITGSGCTRCVCTAGVPVDQVAACITSWNTALVKISNIGTSTALTSDLSVFAKDAWGDPFILDENEGESGGCTRDRLSSAGPDRIHSTVDDIYPHGSIQYIINVTPACPQ